MTGGAMSDHDLYCQKCMRTTYHVMVRAGIIRCDVCGTETDVAGTRTTRVSTVQKTGWAVQAFPKIELPDLSAFQVTVGRFERQLESLPPNWSDDVIYYENLGTVIRDDGIPLVWVPRGASFRQV